MKRKIEFINVMGVDMDRFGFKMASATVKGVLTLLMVLFLSVGTAQATTITGGNLQQILDDITVDVNGNTVGVNSSIDVNTDQLVNDSYWSITGSGQSSATFIVSLSANMTSGAFGIFSGGDMVQIFSGSAFSGATSTVGITLGGDVWLNGSFSGVNFATGNNFGFYISTDSLDTYYSDSSLNGGNDRMVAFQGNNSDIVQIGPWSQGIWTDNEYILAFEDSNGGGSQDFSDLVIMIESVTPVPEPSTLLLLGTGLIGFGILLRRRNKESQLGL